VARGATTAANKSHQNLAFTARGSVEHLSGERSGRGPSEQEGKSPNGERGNPWTALQKVATLKRLANDRPLRLPHKKSHLS
jgi:hypothetical protein